MMTREEVIKGYMINEKHVIAEMLYDTITKYEQRIKSLEAQLANTEQLTCDGCVSEHNTQSYYCSTCERLPRHDYFKAKGTK